MEEAGTAGGNHPPTQFKIVMQKKEQMELQMWARDVTNSENEKRKSVIHADVGK